jgi:hypothetical protein
VIGPSVAAAVYALSAGTSPADRAQRALRLLLESTGAVDGELYLFDRGDLQLAATSRDVDPDENTRARLVQLVDAACASDRTAADTPTRVLRASNAQQPYPASSALLLTCVRNGKHALAGVAALRSGSGSVVAQSPIVPIIADLLISAGDVSPRIVVDETSSPPTARH